MLHFHGKRAHSSRARPLHQSKIPNCYFCQTFMSGWLKEKHCRSPQTEHESLLSASPYSQVNGLGHCFAFLCKGSKHTRHTTFNIIQIAAKSFKQLYTPLFGTTDNCPKLCHHLGQHLPTALATLAHGSGKALNWRVVSYSSAIFSD